MLHYYMQPLQFLLYGCANGAPGTPECIPYTPPIGLSIILSRAVHSSTNYAQLFRLLNSVLIIVTRKRTDSRQGKNSTSLTNIK